MPPADPSPPSENAPARALDDYRQSLAAQPALLEDLAKAGAKEHWLELSRGPVRYLEAGHGPPLVVLHGFSALAGGDRWLAHMPAWTDRFRVIALDLLNWGPGPMPKYEYAGITHIVTSLREMLDALDIERCFLVGHCFGGRISLLFTRESPDRVRALVVAAMSLRGPGDLSVHSAPRPLDSEQAVRDMLVRRMANTPDIDYDQMARWSWRSVTLRPDLVERFGDFMRHFADPAEEIRRDVLRGAWHLVKTPVLFAWPDSDETAPVEDSAALLATIKTSTLRMCRGNHFFPNRYVDEFSALVNGYFDAAMLRSTER